MFQLLGPWFLSRFYLPQGSDVTHEVYDRQSIGFKKPGFPNSVFYARYSRYNSYIINLMWSNSSVPFKALVMVQWLASGNPAD